MSSDYNEDRAYEMGDPNRTRYLQPDEEETDMPEPRLREIAYHQRYKLPLVTEEEIVRRIEVHQAREALREYEQGMFTVKLVNWLLAGAAIALACLCGYYLIAWLGGL
jgi:hypothetical protein